MNVSKVVLLFKNVNQREKSGSDTKGFSWLYGCFLQAPQKPRIYSRMGLNGWLRLRQVPRVAIMVIR